ncbi:thiolase family protein [soil metagenome]
MEAWSLRDRTCVVGVGTTSYGVFPDQDDYSLAVEALSNALTDAGLRYEDLDGLILNRIRSYERFAEITRLDPQYCMRTDEEGRLSGMSLMLAVQAVASGLAEVVACVYGNNAKSAGVTYGGADDVDRWAPWGYTSMGAMHAMMFQRHMHQFGTTSADLAHISVAFRKHAALNPSAVMRKPIAIDDHQASRYIAEPLHLFDYCLINDGGVALIVTSAERAKDLAKPPVFVSGFACQDTLAHSSVPPTDFWYPALQKVERNIYGRSGISRDAVDGLMIYDNFTPTVLFSLEGMGFCPQGEGGAFVRDGALELGSGRWPTNTSGGHLSESYMQGWALLGEAVRQCRGECGQRQISDCEVVQYICATNMALSIIFRS